MMQLLFKSIYPFPRRACSLLRIGVALICCSLCTVSVEAFAIGVEPSHSAIDFDTASEASVILSTKAGSPHWECLVPNLWDDPRGIDVKQTWNSGENGRSVAGRLFASIVNEHPYAIDTATFDSMQTDLTNAVECFVQYCEDSLLAHCQKQEHSFSARVVASRGSLGTKCPSWHVDHVPVRWIQALVGPGCQWATSEAVQWKSLDTDGSFTDEDDEVPRVDESIKGSVHQAPVGQAVMLKGNRWNHFARTATTGSKQILPVVHRSPDRLAPWQGRVLFTMDVHPEA